jgi:hypothetical protein
MNTVGVFAGRGDVIVAMGLALLIGVWIGWQSRRLAEWIKLKSDRKSNHTQPKE